MALEDISIKQHNFQIVWVPIYQLKTKKKSERKMTRKLIYKQ